MNFWLSSVCAVLLVHHAIVVQSFVVHDFNARSIATSLIIRQNEMITLRRSSACLLSEDDDALSGEALLADDVILKVDCSSISPLDEAVESTKKYLRSFPFAAVLPVQPLNYLPSDGGVKVTFLRKKTQEKGSVDGGLCFDVLEGDKPSLENETDDSRSRFQIVGKRITDGQTVSKIFSEKLVVQSIIKSLSGEQDELKVRVESVFHRWL
mmetsp:Transcript_10736/g.14004  ORF Transcript_10736/g.14004 Transcript_10736/m.14004 type:complete len:210 (+) Transcript_10736:161-790(+)